MFCIVWVCLYVCVCVLRCLFWRIYVFISVTLIWSLHIVIKRQFFYISLKNNRRSEECKTLHGLKITLNRNCFLWTLIVQDRLRDVAYASEALSLSFCTCAAACWSLVSTVCSDKPKKECTFIVRHSADVNYELRSHFSLFWVQMCGCLFLSAIIFLFFANSNVVHHAQLLIVD